MNRLVPARCWLPPLAWLVGVGGLPLAATGQPASALLGQGPTLIDRQGRIWEATRPGLWLREGTRKTHFTTQNGLSNDTITALAQAADGQIWVGTREGLLVYEEPGFREITYVEGLPSKRITALYQASGGPLWVGTAAGALRAADHQLTPLPALAGRAVRAMGEDARHWVFVAGQGIWRVPKEQPLSWQWLGWVAGGLVVLGGGLWGSRQLRRGQRVQLRLAQTEQRALLAQMNPHFIFNSLLNRQARRPITLTITDLGGPDPLAPGTRVVVRIPRQHA